ncbi:MAG TPA: Gfo/Idh/MocA family oxidoreductase, partial [Vicinamibacteria bacterium]|nr:Gfo/Idh/MocA family oxidoreductase [Vicinamibacteria bacterium]
MKRNSITRRGFMEAGGAASVAAALAGSSDALPAVAAGPADFFRTAPIPLLRIGFVGCGLQGTEHIKNLLDIEGVELRAVCDIVPEKTERAQKLAKEAGKREPKAFTRGPRDFERLCAEEDLDLVYTATPWEWHVPVMLAAMKNGKHAATEVPAAQTVEDCWKLVETAEKLEKHCILMENCCYDRPELMVLHMVRKGLFGEAMHAEVGYQHDLRAIKFEDRDEGLWRRAHATRLNANLYPTHGLGPAAQAMDVNRGDQFDYLVAMASASRGLQDFQREHLPADDPRRKERYVLGDVHTAMIKTKLGKTIYLVHDTNLPRPYARYNVFQGSKGIYSGFPPRFYFDGQQPAHRYKPLDDFAAQWDHPLWKADRVINAKHGHGGMDFLEDLRLVECLQQGLPTDFDVYDAASWSCMVELTARSTASRSKPVDIPDFTRGRWKSRAP